MYARGRSSVDVLLGSCILCVLQLAQKCTHVQEYKGFAYMQLSKTRPFLLKFESSSEQIHTHLCSQTGVHRSHSLQSLVDSHAQCNYAQCYAYQVPPVHGMLKLISHIIHAPRAFIPLVRMVLAHHTHTHKRTHIHTRTHTHTHTHTHLHSHAHKHTHTHRAKERCGSAVWAHRG